MSVGDFDHHKNGLCGWFGNSLSEHVKEVNKDMFCNCDLN